MQVTHRSEPWCSQNHCPEKGWGRGVESNHSWSKMEKEIISSISLWLATGIRILIALWLDFVVGLRAHCGLQRYLRCFMNGSKIHAQHRFLSPAGIYGGVSSGTVNAFGHSLSHCFYSCLQYHVCCTDIEEGKIMTSSLFPGICMCAAKCLHRALTAYKCMHRGFVWMTLQYSWSKPQHIHLYEHNVLCRYFGTLG